MRDQIIELLGKGIPAAQVAAAVGCDDSYISQLLSSPEVYSRVTELRSAHFSEYVAEDEKLNTAEAAALDRVCSLVPFITRPTEAVRVFGVLNAAKRRAVNAESSMPVVQTVSIELPEAARVSFTLTADRQVIEVAGRSMATMPAKSLAARLEERSAQRLLSTVVPSSLISML